MQTNRGVKVCVYTTHKQGVQSTQTPQAKPLARLHNKLQRAHADNERMKVLHQKLPQQYCPAGSCTHQRRKPSTSHSPHQHCRIPFQGPCARTSNTRGQADRQPSLKAQPATSTRSRAGPKDATRGDAGPQSSTIGNPSGCSIHACKQAKNLSRRIPQDQTAEKPALCSCVLSFFTREKRCRTGTLTNTAMPPCSWMGALLLLRSSAAAQQRPTTHPS